MPLMHYNDVILSKDTILFAESKVLSGNAFVIVLNLKKMSGNQILHSNHVDGSNQTFNGELQEKHGYVFSVLLCALIVLCGLTLI